MDLYACVCFTMTGFFFVMLVNMFTLNKHQFDEHWKILCENAFFFFFFFQFNRKTSGVISIEGRIDFSNNMYWDTDYVFIIFVTVGPQLCWEAPPSLPQRAGLCQKQCMIPYKRKVMVEISSSCMKWSTRTSLSTESHR